MCMGALRFREAITRNLITSLRYRFFISGNLELYCTHSLISIRQIMPVSYFTNYLSYFSFAFVLSSLFLLNTFLICLYVPYFCRLFAERKFKRNYSDCGVAQIFADVTQELGVPCNDSRQQSECPVTDSGNCSLQCSCITCNGIHIYFPPPCLWYRSETSPRSVTILDIIRIHIARILCTDICGKLVTYLL